jgi:drug/metabolite transporter (DMT)-like permease
MTPANAALLLLAVGLAAAGQLTLKHGMNLARHESHTGSRSLLGHAMTSPWILGGLLIFGCSAIAWLVTLANLPLSIAYPFNALGYLVILAASVFGLHEHATVWTWLGTGLVFSGLLVVVLTAPGT